MKRQEGKKRPLLVWEWMGGFHHQEQVPFAWQVLLLKSPPHLDPTRFFLPGLHTIAPFLITHLDLVMHKFFPEPQEAPILRDVHWAVQHTVLGTFVPASHCSPASTIPSPQTGGDCEKSTGGTTTGESEAEAPPFGFV